MNYELWIEKSELWTMDYELWTMNYELWIEKSELWTMNYGLWIEKPPRQRKLQHRRDGWRIKWGNPSSFMNYNMKRTSRSVVLWSDTSGLFSLCLRCKGTCFSHNAQEIKHLLHAAAQKAPQKYQDIREILSRRICRKSLILCYLYCRILIIRGFFDL